MDARDYNAEALLQISADSIISYQQEALEAEIIARVNRAFNNVRRDNGVTLHEAIVYDSFGSEEQRVQARESDREAKWQDIPDEDLNTNHAVLYFLDQTSFRYYIPAFMCWTLKNYSISSSLTVDNTISALYVGSVGSVLRRRHVERLKNFTVWERYAICDFLRYMATQAYSWIIPSYAVEALKFWETFALLDDRSGRSDQEDLT